MLHLLLLCPAAGTLVHYTEANETALRRDASLRWKLVFRLELDCDVIASTCMALAPPGPRQTP